MALSGIGIYLLQRVFVPEVDFWLILCLFWLLYALQVLVRFALGGNWVLHKVSTLPPSMSDPRLENALQAARLAAGLQNKVRLLEVPKQDINSFSLALPDGSHVVFLTTGVAVKLPARKREALAAPGNRLQDGSGFSSRASLCSRPLRPLRSPFRVPALSLAQDHAPSFKPGKGIYADLLAAYWLRDPEAFHLALERASEDVLDLLLPSNLDTILFHPVVDYTSYRPFQTQPTMAERQRRLEERFPSLSSL